jgi:hypothetical protein
VLHRSGVSHSLPIVSSLFKKPIPGITFEILNSAVTLARLFKHFSVTIFPRKEKTRPTDRPQPKKKEKEQNQIMSLLRDLHHHDCSIPLYANVKE